MSVAAKLAEELNICEMKDLFHLIRRCGKSERVMWGDTVCITVISKGYRDSVSVWNIVKSKIIGDRNDGNVRWKCSELNVSSDSDTKNQFETLWMIWLYSLPCTDWYNSLNVHIRNITKTEMPTFSYIVTMTFLIEYFIQDPSILRHLLTSQSCSRGPCAAFLEGMQ